MTPTRDKQALALGVLIDSQREGAIERLPGYRAWIRRRTSEPIGQDAPRAWPGVAGRLRLRWSRSGGARPSGPVFELWLRDPPGDPPREPDKRESSTGLAISRVLRARV